MWKRMIVMLTVTLAIVAGLGFVKFKQVQSAIAQGAAFVPPPEAVTTIVASQEQWPSTLTAIGTVAAVRGVTVSADLPYAQRRWCAAEGIDQVVTLSDHKDMNFSDAFGVHVIDMRITQRALFVLDRDDVVQYAEYVPVMGNEVTFDAALTKARELV